MAAMLLRSSDATALHLLAANYDRAVRNRSRAAATARLRKLCSCGASRFCLLWRVAARRRRRALQSGPRDAARGRRRHRHASARAGPRPARDAGAARRQKARRRAGRLAATVGPAVLRNLVFGGGGGAPGSSLETADSKALIPGRWLGYGEDISGYEEERQGGDYLKSLQNTKPLPMWWRYNGKTPPPWFQPNEPLARGHLLRSSVPIPARRSSRHSTPGGCGQAPEAAAARRVPVEAPVAMPWNGEG